MANAVDARIMLVKADICRDFQAYVFNAYNIQLDQADLAYLGKLIDDNIETYLGCVLDRGDS